MEEMIKQVREASAQGLYYLALLGALTLPDICAALSSKSGKTSGPKFKAWLSEYVPDQAADAEEIYGLRCSLLHEGHTTPKNSNPIACMAPGGFQMHNLSTDVDGDVVGWLSIEMFVDEVTAGAEKWLSEFGETATVKRNLEKFARLRPEGLPPHIEGPVIA